jgi:tetratricopeptide (TPR) repeat protein
MTFKRIPLLFLIFTLSLAVPACSNPEKKKEAHYQKALEYIKKKDNTAAVIELRNAIQIDPKFANARYQLGLLFLQQNDPRNAFAELQRTAGLDQNNLDAGVKVAEFLLLSNNKEESRKYVNQVLKLNPAYADALALLANLELISGNYKEAEAAVTKVAAQERESDRFYNIRGRILAAQQKWPESQAMFEKAIELGPNNFANYRTLLLFFQQQRKNEDVEKLLLTMQEKFPDNPQSHIMMSSLYQTKKQMDKAEAEIKKAIVIEPGTMAFRLRLIDLYKSQNKLDIAEKELRAFLKEKPEALELQTALADLLFDLKKPAEAKPLMEAILAKNPEHGGANLLKAKFLLTEGKTRDAIDILTSLTTNYPKWPEPYFYLALAHLEIGETELAQKAIDSALQNGPAVSRYHTLAAQLFLMKGESETAGKEASIALQLEPRNFSAVKILAKSLIQGKKFQEAVTLIQKVLKQVPDDGDLIGSLGLAYLGLQDKEKATETFTRLVELSPANSKALAILTTLVAENDMNKAVRFIQEHIKTTPQAGGHYMLLGELLAKQKKNEEALAAFKKAQELAPNNPQPYVVIARLMSSLGKTDQAIQELTELLKKHPDSLPGNMGLATLLETKGNYTEAKEKYKKVLLLQPNFSAAANNLAWLIASEKDGDLGEALRLAMLAKQAMPDEAHIADTLGYVHLKRQSFPLAIAQFQQALANKPGDPLITYHLAQAQYGNGEKDQAINAVKGLLKNKEAFKERPEVENTLKLWLSK